MKVTIDIPDLDAFWHKGDGVRLKSRGHDLVLLRTGEDKAVAVPFKELPPNKYCKLVPSPYSEHWFIQ